MAEDRPTTRLFILTPDRIVLDTQITSLRFQQEDGWRGVLPGHTPYITRLVNGVLMYRTPQNPSPQHIALYGGTLEVKRDQVVILTAAAEPGKDLQELAIKLLEHQAEADALAFEAHIELTKMRTALVRALTDLPAPPDMIR
ncbi:MAG: ATP synthase F1 subunit epsilon [Anaerolineae bacterium]|nr:ATP synthase F1 subunit epsilon [Anaerolineae bacterium]